VEVAGIPVGFADVQLDRYIKVFLVSAAIPAVDLARGQGRSRVSCADVCPWPEAVLSGLLTFSGLASG
jgi:hypothetical protein